MDSLPHKIHFLRRLANELGMVGNDGSFMRHPLAFLVEAADDICYTLIDFEDGINLGWISERICIRIFNKIGKR